MRPQHTIGTDDVEEVRILGISGSLRSGSYNSLLVREAGRLAGPGVAVEVYDRLREVPPYVQDEDEAWVEEHEAVADLRRRVRRADGLLIITPEYNYSFPGQLKNALDWLSRPFARSPLTRKPIALGGASETAFGTVRAQLALRQVLLWTESHVVTRPELHLASVHELVDSSGELADVSSQALLADLVSALVRTIADTKKLAVES
jgi:chromate reductase